MIHDIHHEPRNAQNGNAYLTFLAGKRDIAAPWSIPAYTYKDDRGREHKQPAASGVGTVFTAYGIGYTEAEALQLADKTAARLMAAGGKR